MTASTPADPGGLRLDRWLFHARVFKSRGLAAARIERGGVRVNGQPCRKPHRVVRVGDVLVVSAHDRVRAMCVLALGERRGPASEAQTLYEDRTDQAQNGASDGLIDPPGTTNWADNTR